MFRHNGLLRGLSGLLRDQNPTDTIQHGELVRLPFPFLIAVLKPTVLCFPIDLKELSCVAGIHIIGALLGQKPKQRAALFFKARFSLPVVWPYRFSADTMDCSSSAPVEEPLRKTPLAKESQNAESANEQ